jgi:hypothetical protein
MTPASAWSSTDDGEDEERQIADAGVETGAKMLGVSIACCMPMRGSKVHANAKRLV